jgi:hypothetical protein
MRDGHDLYFSASGKVKLYIDTSPDTNHIVRANLPIKIHRTATSEEIEILDSGLQQLKLYAPKGINVTTKDWKVVKEGNYYILTRYGDKIKLHIKYN